MMLIYQGGREREREMMEGERKKLLSLDATCQNKIMLHFQCYSLTLNKKHMDGFFLSIS